MMGILLSSLLDEKHRNKLMHILQDRILGNPFFWVAVVLVVIMLVILKYGRRPKENKHLLLAAGLYTLTLFDMLVLCREETGGKIVKVYLGSGEIHESTIIMAVFNMLLFIPLGILLKKCFAKSFVIPMVIAVVIGIGMEVLQLVCSRGIFMVSDIGIYAVGSFIGCLVGRINRSSSACDTRLD